MLSSSIIVSRAGGPVHHINLAHALVCVRRSALANEGLSSTLKVSEASRQTIGCTLREDMASRKRVSLTLVLGIPLTLIRLDPLKCI